MDQESDQYPFLSQLNKQTKKPTVEDTSNPRYLSLPRAVRSELGSKVRNQPANSRKLNEEWGLPIMIIEVRIKVANEIEKFFNV